MTTNNKECQFCCSQIPEKAVKCKYCHEWQEKASSKDTRSPSEDFVSFSGRFPALRRIFQLKIVEKIPFHYLVSVFIVGIIIFATIQFLWYRLSEEKVYLLSFLVYTAQMIFSWSGLIWIHEVFNRNLVSYVKISGLTQEEAEQTFVTHHNRIFSYSYSILVGVITGAVACAGDYWVGLPFKTLEARVIYAVFEFINMFFAGAGIYSMLMYAFFVHKMSSSSDENLLRLDSSDCVANIGKVHLKTCVIGICPLCLGVIGRLLGDFSWGLPILMWYGSFAVLIVCYIYWPMMNIHKLMRGNIEQQLNLIKTKMEETLFDIKTRQSVRSVVRLDELRELESSILKESTWPFDPKNISVVFSAVGFPIILMIIEKIWSFSKP